MPTRVQVAGFCFMITGTLFLLFGFFVGLSWEPEVPQHDRELQQRPDPLISVQFLRETDVRDGGLSISRGGVAPYASSFVRERAEALVDQEVYIKMLMYDIIEGREHRGIELRVQDVADRHLLDEVARKVGERRGLRTVMAGWERYAWCTLIEHNTEKGLLTMEIPNGKRVTGQFFGSTLPAGNVFRVVTVDASESLGTGMVVVYTGIVSVEAVKD
ncbi:hypothetical protein HYZ98_01595 [Candidatus Peregrinibacteria bacterium]|nr:hypothetical protein [Candidatus Peregrinibacteria bacterium]